MRERYVWRDIEVLANDDRYAVIRTGKEGDDQVLIITTSMTSAVNSFAKAVRG